MHGLIFETSVWLLAGSTRLIWLKVKHYQKQIWFYLTHPVVIQPIHSQTNSQTVPIPLTNQSKRTIYQNSFLLQMSFKPWFQMHSVRKYPIDTTVHWTLKQNYPPHIVFWGVGLPFTHPYQFYTTFVSKTEFFDSIHSFVSIIHSKSIYNPNHSPFVHFWKIGRVVNMFPPITSRSHFRKIDLLTGVVGPENVFIWKTSNLSEDNCKSFSNEFWLVYVFANYEGMSSRNI